VPRLVAESEEVQYAQLYPCRIAVVVIATASAAFGVFQESAAEAFSTKAVRL
jgi:hypothetical protein